MNTQKHVIMFISHNIHLNQKIINLFQQHFMMNEMQQKWNISQQQREREEICCYHENQHDISIKTFTSLISITQKTAANIKLWSRQKAHSVLEMLLNIKDIKPLSLYAINILIKNNQFPTKLYRNFIRFNGL